MTFNPTYMSPYEVGVGQSSMRWHYDTLDLRAVVEAPGYFNAFADKLSIGDIIEVLVSDSVVADTRTVVFDSFTLMVRGTTGGVTTDESALEAQFARWIGTTYGVPNNGTDAAATLRAAAAAVGQDEVIRIRPGTYVVNSDVTGQDVKNPTWESDYGFETDLTSAGNWFMGRADPASIGAVPISDKIIIGGTSKLGSENFGYTSWRVNAMGDPAGHQKVAHRFSIIAEEPSLGESNGGPPGSPTVNHGAIALRADAYLAAGNMAGHLYAMGIIANLGPGSDGRVTGIEIDLANKAGADASPSSLFNKHGIQIVSSFGAGTDAVKISGGGEDTGHPTGQGWWNGISGKRGCIFDDPDARFINYDDGITPLFEVDKDGSVQVGDALGGLLGQGSINAETQVCVNGLSVLLDDYINAAWNGDFENGEVGWAMPANGSVVNDPTNAETGNYVYLNTDVSGVVKSLDNNARIPIKPGESAYVEARLKTAAGMALTALRACVMWYDKDNVALSSTNGNNFITDQLTYVSSVVGDRQNPAVAPANTAYFTPRVNVTKTAGNVWVDSVVAYKRRKRLRTEQPDFGTTTAAGTGGTSTATLSTLGGIITTDAITTAAAASHVMTVTNTLVAAGDDVSVWRRTDGTNTTKNWAIGSAVTGTSTFTVTIDNNAAAAINGNIKFGFEVKKAA